MSKHYDWRELDELDRKAMASGVDWLVAEWPTISRALRSGQQWEKNSEAWEALCNKLSGDNKRFLDDYIERTHELIALRIELEQARSAAKPAAP